MDQECGWGGSAPRSVFDEEVVKAGCLDDRHGRRGRPLNVALEPKLRALHLRGMLQTLENRLGAGPRRPARPPGVPGAAARGRDRAAPGAVAAGARQPRPLRRGQAWPSSTSASTPRSRPVRLRDLATCRYLERRGVGHPRAAAVGLGKSHLAQALGWEACARGYTVLFTKTSHMLQDLGAGHLDGYLAAAPAPLPQAAPAHPGRLRDARLQRPAVRGLVRAGRRAGPVRLDHRDRQPGAGRLDPLFANPVLAEGILDRLLNAAHRIVLTGRSYRPQLRPDRDPTGPRPRRIPRRWTTSPLHPRRPAPAADRTRTGGTVSARPRGYGSRDASAGSGEPELTLPGLPVPRALLPPPADLLLGRLPASRPPATSGGAAATAHHAADPLHRLPVSGVRTTLPRRVAVLPVQPVLPPARRRRRLSALRRARRRQRPRAVTLVTPS